MGNGLLSQDRSQRSACCSSPFKSIIINEHHPPPLVTHALLNDAVFIHARGTEGEWQSGAPACWRGMLEVEG